MEGIPYLVLFLYCFNFLKIYFERAVKDELLNLICYSIDIVIWF